MVAEVSVLAPQPLKPESWHHSTVYGVAASPESESVEAVHVQVGVLSELGSVVEGVPGVEGAVVSTKKGPK